MQCNAYAKCMQILKLYLQEVIMEIFILMCIQILKLYLQEVIMEIFILMRMQILKLYLQEVIMEIFILMRMQMFKIVFTSHNHGDVNFNMYHNYIVGFLPFGFRL